MQNCKTQKQNINNCEFRSYVFYVREFSKQKSDYLYFPQFVFIDSLAYKSERKIPQDYLYFSEYISFWGYGMSSDPFNSYLCCKYGDIKEGLSIYFSDGLITKNDYNSFESDYSRNFNKLRRRDAFIFNFEKNQIKYQVLAWSVNVDYCICELFLSSFNQKLYSNKAVYLKKIINVQKIDNQDVLLFSRIINGFLNTSSSASPLTSPQK